MRTAPGTGIVSSAILQSDVLDELDYEWIGGVPTQVQTNYFGKGNTTSYDRATYVDMADTQNAFHNYTIEWTEKSTNWLVNGKVVRSLQYEEAVGGENYPQTPMNIRIGSWAGGDSSNNAGTIQWAGGATNYDEGPFTMYLKKVEVKNYNPGSSYTYSDKSGDWSSIVVA